MPTLKNSYGPRLQISVVLCWVLCCSWFMSMIFIWKKKVKFYWIKYQLFDNFTPTYPPINVIWRYLNPKWIYMWKTSKMKRIRYDEFNYVSPKKFHNYRFYNYFTTGNRLVCSQLAARASHNYNRNNYYITPLDI